MAINSDSKSSLQTLNKNCTTKCLVKETKERLNEAALSTNIKFRWVKGHDDNNRGNHRADSLANRGADPEEGSAVDDLPKIPFSLAKSK